MAKKLPKLSNTGDELTLCECGGSVSHMLKNYEESIIVCDKCDKQVDIEQLWQAYRALSLPLPDSTAQDPYLEMLGIMQEVGNLLCGDNLRPYIIRALSVIPQDSQGVDERATPLLACVEYIRHQLTAFRWYCPECIEPINILIPEILEHIDQVLKAHGGVK